GAVLTRVAYEAVGRVSGALTSRAEALYGELDDDGKEAARQLFLRLVTVGDSADTRRRVLHEELDSLDVDQDALASCITGFGASRLLSFDRDLRTGESTIEIAHEALLAEWQRLKAWIDEARDDVRVHRRLAAAAAEWEESGGDPSFLARGSQLPPFETGANEARRPAPGAERRHPHASGQPR